MHAIQCLGQIALQVSPINQMGPVVSLVELQSWLYRGLFLLNLESVISVCQLENQNCAYESQGSHYEAKN